ncbi:hypothetical protein E4T47_04336 [Aureobasidium subglaciale]|nr:hypothetical protein E4T47_04336 [Aureobasidium subglaciale]
MAFIFTCGTHTFNSLLAGSENITAQCQNCGNFTAKVYKRWEWFTFCFVVSILGMNVFLLVACLTCLDSLSYHSLSSHTMKSVATSATFIKTSDVQEMMNNGQSSQQIPMQPYGAPPQQYKAPSGPPQYV